MSIGGGLPNAVERAELHGCEALQIFTKSAGMWRARVIPTGEIATFRRRVEESGIRPVVSHASYLINLAARDEALRERSIAALGDELDRAEALGLLGVVLHPGACTGGTDTDGLERIGSGLRAVLRERPRRRARVLLEHTAGQGTVLGHRFEQLATILDEVNGSRRVGVWLDTCHLIAAGYDIVTPSGYAATFRAFDRLIGVDRLAGFHLNDSKRPLGSRVDRHEHIGDGHLGLEPFRRLVNDRRFAGLPMLIETAKTEGRERTRIVPDPLDARNLAVLRSLRVRGPAEGLMNAGQ
jgi:deoxyribonuclease-4